VTVRFGIDHWAPAAVTSESPGPDIETVWIAVVDGQPAATAALLKNPGYWEVKRVFVSPDFRRRALAQRALAKVEASALDLGVRELVLQTGILQPEAIALYSREGWNRIPGFGPYAGDDGSVCFRKTLAGPPSRRRVSAVTPARGPRLTHKAWPAQHAVQHPQPRGEQRSGRAQRR
jgi:GNAT superfamily N-acetyltransferase